MGDYHHGVEVIEINDGTRTILIRLEINDRE